MIFGPRYLSVVLRLQPFVQSALKQKGERVLRHHTQLRMSSTSKGYRSAVCIELGKPLSVEDQAELPEPDEGQVRVAVHNAGINFADILMVAGLYQEKPPVPFYPGSEISGEISAVGPGVTKWKKGDRVCGMPLWGLAGFSQQCLAEEQGLWRIPPSVSTQSAVSCIVTYSTAYLALHRRAHIRPGDTVLVTAAAGGVGLAAVDLAANVFGAQVIGACGGPHKKDIVLSKGARHVIDYNTESIKDRVREITDGNGADIVFDAVGGSAFKEAMRCIALEGRLVVIGFASGDIPKIPANHLLVKNISAVGVYWGQYKDRNPQIFNESVTQVLKYLEEGRIQPHISASYPLDKINEALKFVQMRKSTGKVILNMSSNKANL